MKVIIACLNSKFVHASLSPWCLLAGVRAFGARHYDITVAESTINSDTSEFAQKIISEKPDVVAFSCYIWNITKTLEACRIIRQNHSCTIVLGGPEVAYRPKDVLEKYGFADFVLSGEGEWCFPALLDNLGGDLSLVAGLSYRHNGEVCINPGKEYTDTPPSPYCDEFFKILNGRIAYIETARGCPYRCAFCLSGRGSPLRFFDIDRVKEDIIRLSRSDTQTVKFVDRTFNADAKRADKILLFIKENYGKAIPGGVCFHFEIAGDILKESTLGILESMPRGAVQLEIGMQSFNEETLRKINRRTDTAKLIENIKKLIG
ncbi:MAG: B12-binding domain-containing radical SAM protein, partial [Clostridia bacterium]|nr:B12-binding domain-containing radical SAM protein [Clostridia bacterium]